MLDEINSYLPDGWSATTITCLDPEWQVIAKDDEHVVVATGENIELALAQAAYNIQNYIFVGRLFSLGRMSYHEDDKPAKPKLNPQRLLQSLGLVKDEPFTRRA
jgi:hypothetical protein